MSVQVYKRNKSDLFFVHGVYELECDLLSYIVHAPKRYTSLIGDKIIGDCDKALFNARAAENCYPFLDRYVVLKRNYHLTLEKSAIETIAEHVQIWTDLINRNEGYSPEKQEKVYKREEQIGLKCNAVISAIDGLIESDLTRWNSAHPNNPIVANDDRSFEDVNTK